MSRSGYTDDCDDNWTFIRWRGAVSAAVNGKRGQAFLREMLAALDAMPVKRLISYELEKEGEVCALGAVGKARGLAMDDLDPDDAQQVASAFSVSYALVCETTYVNDEVVGSREIPEQRFERVRRWVASVIRTEEQEEKPA